MKGRTIERKAYVIEKSRLRSPSFQIFLEGLSLYAKENKSVCSRAETGDHTALKLQARPVLLLQHPSRQTGDRGQLKTHIARFHAREIRKQRARAGKTAVFFAYSIFQYIAQLLLFIARILRSIAAIAQILRPVGQ